MGRTSSTAPTAAHRGNGRGARLPRIGAFDAGVRFLSRRPYAGVELSRKLTGLGYPEDEVRSALNVFAELGYIDDATFAEAHVRRRSNRRGPRALAAELAARGVDRQLVSQAIGRLDRDSQVRAAARLVHRAIGGNRPATYEELLDSAGPKLLRRGFSHAIAWAACREVWTGADGASET